MDRRMFSMGSTNISRLGAAGIGLISLAERKECCSFRVMLYRSSRVATNAISFVRTLRRLKSR